MGDHGHGRGCLPGQNELKTLDDLGLDIRPHRERMNREDLAEKFKDTDDALRLVFVCAMWTTGFTHPLFRRCTSTGR